MATLLVRQPTLPRAERSATRKTVLDGLGRIEEYPTLSDTTIRAVAILNSANVSVPEVAGIIRRDAIVAASVIRLANTCLYRGRFTVCDIQKAVLRIGMKECGKLVCSVGIQAMTSSLAPDVRRRCDQLHRHSLFVASIASNINRVAGLGFVGVEFTAGLLHDIGRVVMSVKAPRESEEADPMNYREDEESLILERNVFGIDHCAVGYQFATLCKLPDQVVRAILNHRPHEEKFEPALVRLIAFADTVANHVQREHNITGFISAECLAFEHFLNGWTEARKTAFCTALPGLVVRAFKETKAMLKSSEVV